MTNIFTAYSSLHAKFQVTEFKDKKDIRHRSLDFVYFTGPGDWWFLASDGSEIQASVEDFRPIN